MWAVYSDMNIFEEFLDFVPLVNTTKGEDIFETVLQIVTKYELPWRKLVYVATDGAPTMRGEQNVFIGILRQFLKSMSEIDAFFKSEGMEIPELTNEEWISDLAFLTDLTMHLDNLNTFIFGLADSPFAIFKGVRFREVYKHSLPAGSEVAMSDSGYVNEDVFLKWLEHFQKHCSPVKCLLILAGIMSRTHIAPKTKAVLKKWVTSVREKKMGLRKAVKLYNVPQTTLQRFVNNNMSPEECVKLKIGRKTVLLAELEKQLMEFLVEMDNRFYGLTRTDVKRMAYQLAQQNNILYPFGSNVTAGRAWFDLFIRRHKNTLTIHKPIGTSFSRANGFNREAINKFFDMLEAECDKHSYPADRVYNVDETGLTVVQSKIPHVIGLKGKQQVGAITSAERGSLPRTNPHQPSEIGLRDGCSKSADSDSQKACVSPKDIMPVPQLKKTTYNRGRKQQSLHLHPTKLNFEQSLVKAKERIAVKLKLTKNKFNKGNKINKSKSCKRRLMLDQKSDKSQLHQTFLQENQRWTFQLAKLLQLKKMPLAYFVAMLFRPIFEENFGHSV
ncbi:hypothetical protein ANN_14661 [Periplaneta americana]|uniref:HTH CENPB-type domain-containing protein n=1 Tax=Periplaneta americana TaxID=6978 RepID=A0ABQ8SWY7_PERAM|nr:hypothetical protein ANN_14661 [Periplaneta americana]